MPNHEFPNSSQAHREAVSKAIDHLDAKNCPEDSIMRGLVDITLACSEVPPLGMLMSEMYPKREQLCQ